MKTMAIIGIILFALHIVGQYVFETGCVVQGPRFSFTNLLVLYSAILSFTLLLKQERNQSSNLSVSEELQRLDDLRKKGIIKDEEFELMKLSLLGKYSSE